jgi:uncharacterized protein YjbI with pentapeptide repeats
MQIKNKRGELIFDGELAFAVEDPDLREAVLEGMILEGAHFDGANLQGGQPPRR